MAEENVMKALLIEYPEGIFNLRGLTHKSREIDDILDRFDRALDPRAVHKKVMDLLHATKIFRLSTAPDGIFSQLRTLTKSDDELIAIFNNMNHVIEAVTHSLESPKTNQQDKEILFAALHYCKESIRKRMTSLSSDDRLISFWNHSHLKKQLEK